ncbi:hypothetical protein BOX15_Mlig023012g1 [Macrostomum lignano]|uniref:Major facilitator superfamily (MFS) profile domain-containing protein n=1 Tax=Macrostomum lignano TaxID=282301 RepID=A0A267FII4_9PLAT|nr:hypothetical protein BOX15_Mlig023012g1 [Macrostomum lignano]
MLYEDLLTHISKSGPAYRWIITVLIAFLSMKSAFDMFVLNLATASVPYHCAEALVDGAVQPWSEVLANNTFATNFSINDFTCQRPKFVRGLDGSLHMAMASAAGGNGSTATPKEEICGAWTFRPDPPERWTMFMEYEMVCDRKYLMDRMQTVMQFGICLSTIFGPLGDILGRKPLLVAFCYLDLTCNIAVIFVRNLTLQMVLRFCMGFGAPAVLIGIILITELVAEDYRGIHGNLVWTLWVFAYSGSAAISYFIYNWRIQMVVVVLIIGAGYATYIPVLPESPRWLLTRGKTKRAKKILKEVSKYSGCKEVLNEFNFEHNELVDPPEHTNESEEQSCIFKFIPRENLCRLEYLVTVGVVTFNFFTVSLVYFALSFKRDFITNNPYLNVLISGLLELPAYILAWQLTNRAGRKYTCLGTMAFCGVGLIILPYVPTDPEVVFQGSSVLAIAIKFSVTVAFSVLAVYGSEVLPTKVRSCSFFFACFLMRSAQILAPELGGALAQWYIHLPYLLYGVISVLASLAILLLPETKDKPMPNTVAEMEQVGCPCCVSGSDEAERQGASAGEAGGEEMKPLRV